MGSSVSAACPAAEGAVHEPVGRGCGTCEEDGAWTADALRRRAEPTRNVALSPEAECWQRASHDAT